MKVKNVELSFSTSKDFEILDITDEVSRAVKYTEVKEGLCLVFSLHTTTALVINEREPGLLDDFRQASSKLFPKGAGWRHDLIDTNAHAHLASTFMGNFQVIPITNGSLLLGTWQRLLLVELDGPRRRRVIVTAIGE